MNDRNQTLSRVAGSLSSRRYLLGVVLAWVLIVYLVSGSSPPRLASAPSTQTSSGTGAQSSQAAAAVTPSMVTAVAPPAVAPTSTLPVVATTPGTAPLITTAPSTQSSGSSPSFSAPGTAPKTAEMNCPYPIPQAQSSPISPGVVLSFLGPLTELQGPFSSWGLPTIGAIGPLIPMVTPFISIAQPVLNDITPDLSTVVSDLVYIETKAGLDNAQAQALAAEYEPDWIKLLDTIEPVEQALAATTGSQCLTLFTNELAQEAAKYNLNLPALPLIPPIPGSTNVGAAALSESHDPFTTVPVTWSTGLPSSELSLMRSLVAKKVPVIAELVDVPPRGQSLVGTGFADFVASAVSSLHGVTAFEIAGPTSNPSGGAQIADLVHGLAAADYARQPGQLIGMAVPPAAQGPGAVAFWKAFAAAMKGWQPDMVDFVAAELTPAAVGTIGAGVSDAVAQATALEREWTTIGKVPSGVPLFATVAAPASSAESVTMVRAVIGAYEAALQPLDLGVLGILP